jgi:hypothetical protein
LFILYVMHYSEWHETIFDVLFEPFGFLLLDIFELFDFPFCRLWACLIGVIPGTRRVH